MALRPDYNIIVTPGSSDVEVKKSHFITSLRCCRTEEEARLFIEEVRRANRDARHNCFAMRIGDPSSVFERFSDDGEPQGTAGKPMLDLLKGARLCDVCAVVTRYFGGTLLGTGGLVRAYSDSLKEALSASDISSLNSGAKVSVRCDYSTANRLQRAAASMDLFTMDVIYGADCEQVYLVPDEDVPVFIRKVTDISAGTAKTAIKESVLYYGKERPAVYAVRQTEEGQTA
jgi:uncharacterized YigZ family protein